MGDVIHVPAWQREPNKVTRAALFTEAMDEWETGFSDAELNELREIFQQNKREQMVNQLRKQCIAVNTFLHELLANFQSNKSNN
jgi:predicted ABC-class ATPase